MDQTAAGAYEQYSDEALMHRYLELSDRPEDNATELAAIDTVVQSRLFAAYGSDEPDASPRVRFAA